MQLNGKTIEITNVEKFFTVMDSFEKQVLSNNIHDSGIPQTENYAVFIVSNHAVGLPLEAPEKLAPHMKYVENEL